MPRFMLKGPRQCAIFYFAHLLCMSYVTKTFLLNSSSVSNKQLLCFVSTRSRPKKKTKTYTQRTLSSFVHATSKDEQQSGPSTELHVAQKL